MAEITRMPLLSDTMTEGVIVEWHKEIGEHVESGELLAEIETDKATMEFESYEAGILLYRAPLNTPVAVNAILAIIGEKGEDIQAILDAEKSNATAEAPATETENKATSTPTLPPPTQHTPPQTAAFDPTPPPPPAPTTDGRLKASPLAKRLAKENNIDIRLVTGSGDEGRIIKRDIEAFLAQPKPTPTPAVQAVATAKTNGVTASTPMPVSSFTGQESYEEIPLSQMRKTIARRLGESKFGAPHFYLRMTIRMDKVVSIRKSLNEQSPVKISFNDIIIKTAAVALRQHPAVNGSWLGDKIRYNKHIHIGMAVAVEEGLLVPVIRFADNKSLSQVAAETKALGQKANTKKLQLPEMQGNTFTISNLGMMDIDEFTAIINPPDSCILAVGKIAQVPAVVDGEIKVVHEMKVTLSCDHRIVDGATGARFLQTFKGLLEDPIRLLI